MAYPKVFAEINERLERIESLLTEKAPQEQETKSIDPDIYAHSIDYDTYSAAEIIARADSLMLPEQRQALIDYERRNKNRKTVLEALKTAFEALES